ncbi:uncharacterized protein DS421_1g10180 [Arachis hypogaea]|nr:uncharacterized protein DS421_1g10180 [Arachis hypogaea]
MDEVKAGVPWACPHAWHTHSPIGACPECGQHGTLDQSNRGDSGTHYQGRATQRVIWCGTPSLQQGRVHESTKSMARQSFNKGMSTGMARCAISPEALPDLSNKGVPSGIVPLGALEGVARGLKFQRVFQEPSQWACQQACPRLGTPILILERGNGREALEWHANFYYWRVRERVLGVARWANTTKENLRVPKQGVVAKWGAKSVYAGVPLSVYYGVARQLTSSSLVKGALLYLDG